jgi:hypothetical protein
MPANAGKRYVSPAGAEVIVTKGGAGELSDGETPLFKKEEAPADLADAAGRSEPLLSLGKRYRSEGGEVELLVIKAGVCDLRYNGQPMEALQPKILPSAD